MDSLMAQKAEQRQRLSGWLAQMTPADRRLESEALVERLLDYAKDQWTVVLATLPMATEPNLMPFLSWWLGRGRLALARTGPGRSLTFRYVDSLEGPWDTKPFGMREPPAEAPVWVAGPSTLALVPGLGFAESGTGGVSRLGRGAGYYDRWLADHGNDVFSLGVGFAVQWVHELPVEGHDRFLDGFMGPQGLRSSVPRRAD
jgi:5-formyltetrahydrofolate cyclo-ligase